MKNPVLLLLSCLCLMTAMNLGAQESKEYETAIFRGTRIVNGHSVETLRSGEMEFIISHRFGRLNGGAYELFGLDQASIRLGLDYGVNDRLTVGFGRSSLGKHYDGFAKLRLLRQGANYSGFPFALTFFSSVAINTLKASNPEQPILFQNRLAYTFQALIARKFSDRFSAQLMPSLVHFNLVDTPDETNDKVSIGLAAKYQLTKNLAITGEYYHTLPGHLSDGKFNSLSFGFDLNTGSHVFQLHFTNSAGMIEKAFIGETNGEWNKGDIHFGFNMVRTFKLKGRRY